MGFDLTATFNGETPVKPVEPNKYGWYFQCGFEGDTSGFSARGPASIASSSDTAFVGSNSLYVSGRESAWNGASYKLDSRAFKAGTEYSFSAIVSYLNGASSDKFHLTLQYKGSDGVTHYDKIASETVAKGEWVQLANTSYKIPEGASDLEIYVETDDASTSFYVDEVIGAVAGTGILGPEKKDPEPQPQTNLYPVVKTQVKDHKIGFKWDAVEGAEKYGIGVYQANKWVVKKQVDASVHTWTSPKVANGTYRMVVLAKVNGEWVKADVFKHAFYVTVN